MAFQDRLHSALLDTPAGDLTWESLHRQGASVQLSVETSVRNTRERPRCVTPGDALPSTCGNGRAVAAIDEHADELRHGVYSKCLFSQDKNKSLKAYLRLAIEYVLQDWKASTREQ